MAPHYLVDLFAVWLPPTSLSPSPSPPTHVPILCSNRTELLIAPPKLHALGDTAFVHAIPSALPLSAPNKLLAFKDPTQMVPLF